MQHARVHADGALRCKVCGSHKTRKKVHASKRLLEAIWWGWWKQAPIGRDRDGRRPKPLCGWGEMAIVKRHPRLPQRPAHAHLHLHLHLHGPRPKAPLRQPLAEPEAL